MLPNVLQQEQAVTRLSKQSSRKHAQQHTAQEAFGVQSQQDSAVICESYATNLQTDKGRPLADRAEISDLEAQIIGLAALLDEEKIQATTLAREHGNSRRTIEKLADENVRLETRLAASQSEREVAQDALDKILSDLITSQRELEEKKEALEKNEARLLDLRQKTDRLLAQLEEKEDHFKKKENDFMERVKSSEAEMREMREQQSQLTVQLERTKTAVEDKQKGFETAEGQPQEVLPKEESVDTQLHELRRVVESKEAALSQLEADKRKAELDAQQLRNVLATREREALQTDVNAQELMASHSAELEQPRRVSNFFKATSERLSKETKEMIATNRSLQESVEVKDRELKEQRLLVRSLYDDISELHRRRS
jgi:chromosome segregation ATPase